MGRSIKSDAVYHGRNAEYSKYDDRRYVRCSRCGFICNLDRDDHLPRGSHAGWGLKFDRAFTQTTISAGVATIVEGADTVY